MKIKQAFTYLSSVIVIYLLVFGLEIILTGDIIEGLGLNYKIKLIIVISCLIVINPLVTLLIVNKLPFKPKGLKASDTYQSDIKRKPASIKAH